MLDPAGLKRIFNDNAADYWAKVTVPVLVMYVIAV